MLAMWCVCIVIVPLVSVMVHIVGQYRVNFSLVPRPFIQRVPYIVYYVKVIHAGVGWVWDRDRVVFMSSVSLLFVYCDVFSY